jgi:hypothetical protein
MKVPRQIRSAPRNILFLAEALLRPFNDTAKLIRQPEGVYKITSIVNDPTWRYQPELLGESEDKRDAVIPPGLNGAVGRIRMRLSKPNYGIMARARPKRSLTPPLMATCD